jgi:hypothetical protein
MSTIAASSPKSFWKRGAEEVSLARLYAIRAVALLGVYGLFTTVMTLVDHAPDERGMLKAMISGLWIMCLITIRYPLKMIPILLFELVWKLLWLFFFGIPQWWTGVGSPRLGEDLWSIGAFPLVCVLVIPWGYVWRHYIKEPAERWR